MTARRSGWRTWGAILAAYLLVLQATLTGMTLGAHAAPSAGVVGAVICSSATTSSDAAPGRGERHVLPNCCVLGCSMSGGGAAPGSDSVRLDAPAAAAFLHRSYAFDAVSATPERSPRTTRAPPLTA